MGGIRDEVIALDFNGAAEIRLLLHDAEIRLKEQENLLAGLFSNAVKLPASMPSADQAAVPASTPAQGVFYAGDPRLSDPFDPKLPKNRTVIFGVKPPSGH